MEHSDILKQFENDFAKMRAQLKLTATFEELDEIFFLRDFALKTGFVSPGISRMVCSRLVETFMNWNNYLHGLIIPNPNYMISVAESQAFDDKEKEEIMRLMSQIMAHVSTNSVIGLTKDRALEAQFIDNSVTLWKTTVNPKLIQIIGKVNTNWQNRSTAPSTKT